MRPFPPAGNSSMARSDLSSRWASSGALALTGRPDGPPLIPPDGVIRRIVALGRDLDSCGGLDPLALLGERAAIAGLSRQGAVSCGGATSILPTADGAIAVSLARTEDLTTVPAWLELPAEGWLLDDVLLEPGTEEKHSYENTRRNDQAADEQDQTLRDRVWQVASAVLRSRRTDEVVDRGRLLGLPIAPVPVTPPAAPSGTGPFLGLPVRATPIGPPSRDRQRSSTSPLVVDLSSLWAGPLCAHLLGLAGARVVKVESIHRPDGARRGPAQFFDLLHAGHEAVALDFRERAGVAKLIELVTCADVVIEGSRPRALGQLGLVPEDLLATPSGPRNPAADPSRAVDALAMPGATTPRILGEQGAPSGPATPGPRVWVSITGHGREAPGRNWVAFGDDAATAGGLLALGPGVGEAPSSLAGWPGLAALDSTAGEATSPEARRPGPVTRGGTGLCFVADAVADPLSGMVAAAAVRRALAAGGTWLLDVSMAAVAAHVAAGAHEDPDPQVLRHRRHAGHTDSGEDRGRRQRTWRPGTDAEATPPRARTPSGRGPALGQHTAHVLSGLP